MNYLRPYDVYAILGDPARPPAWSAPVWQRIASALDALVTGTSGAAAVRTMQLRPGHGSPNQRSIAFGRLGWNDRSHAKWVHQPGDEREFMSAEVWAPSWSVCEKRASPPDLLLTIHHGIGSKSAPRSFDPLVVFAVAADENAPDADRARGAARELAEILNAVLFVHDRRTWGEPIGTGATRVLQDLWLGLFRLGPVPAGTPVASDLQGTWQTL